jgi:hypothetical protein
VRGDITGAGGERGKDRVEVLHNSRLATDHNAVPALEPPDAAARADIDVVNTARREVLSAADIVDVVRVSAVDERIAFLQQREEFGDGFVDNGGGHHQPNCSRLRQLFHEIRQRRCADGFVFSDRFHGLRKDIVRHALVAATDEPPHHVRAHSAKADHSQLHDYSFVGCAARRFFTKLRCLWTLEFDGPSR